MRRVDMKITARLATLVCVALLAGGSVFASDVDELTVMLHEFLATSGEEQAHARFWAEDLVYSSSAGLRFGKADIMAGFDITDEPDDATDKAAAIIYTGEEIESRQTVATFFEQWGGASTRVVSTSS